MVMSVGDGWHNLCGELRWSSHTHTPTAGGLSLMGLTCSSQPITSLCKVRRAGVAMQEEVASPCPNQSQDSTAATTAISS